MTETDIDRLCAVIDAGDDSALPILADALEDAGDRRAAGLRYCVRQGYRPEAHYASPEQYGWRGVSVVRSERYDVALVTQYRLLGQQGISRTNAQGWVWYPSRSAAYLALALVLTEDRERKLTNV